jgi:Tfp pilus assembly protein PilF
MDRIDKLKSFLEESPDDNLLKHALALEYIKAGRDHEARVIFEQILTSTPDYVGSYYHLGKLLERNGENRLAIEWYQKGMMAAKRLNDQKSYNELQSAYEDLAYY